VRNTAGGKKGREKKVIIPIPKTGVRPRRSSADAIGGKGGGRGGGCDRPGKKKRQFESRQKGGDFGREQIWREEKIPRREWPQLEKKNITRGERKRRVTAAAGNPRFGGK